MAGLKISDIINKNNKPAPVKDMHPVVSFEEAQKIIYKNLVTASESFISIGYYLKMIRDGKMYEEGGFSDIWEFSRSIYGLGRSAASRWMAMNDKYSVDGNSPYIDERFKGYGKSQLQEMLYLTDEQMEQVEEGMTVKEIREIRKPEECATSHTEETVKDEVPEYDEKEFVKRLVQSRIYLEDFKEICRRNQTRTERALALQKKIALYGFTGGTYKEFAYQFYGFAKGIEMEIGKQRCKMSYRQLVRLIDEMYGPYAYETPEEVMECATSHADSGCDGKCFNCDNEGCNGYQGKRKQCVLDSSYVCTTMNVVELLKQDDPEMYANCVGCCNACPQKTACSYSCNRPQYIVQKKEEEKTYPEMETLDNELCVEGEVVEFEECATSHIGLSAMYNMLDVSLVLEQEEHELSDYLGVEGLPDMLVKRKYMLVDALRLLREEMKKMLNSKQKEFMEIYRRKIRRMTNPELKDEWERVRHALNPNCKERQQDDAKERSEPEFLCIKSDNNYKCSKCKYCRGLMREKATRYLFYCDHNRALFLSPEHLKFGKTFICYGKSGGIKEPLVLNSPRWCPMKFEKKRGE